MRLLLFFADDFDFADVFLAVFFALERREPLVDLRAVERADDFFAVLLRLELRLDFFAERERGVEELFFFVLVLAIALPPWIEAPLRIEKAAMTSGLATFYEQ